MSYRMTHTTKHTPGPWQISAIQNEPEKMSIIDADMCFVAEVWQTYIDGESRQQAHAALIAAAPAMYEALTALLAEEDIVSIDSGPDECRWCGRTYPDIDNEGELQVLCASDDCPGYIARQAIAQAEGK